MRDLLRMLSIGFTGSIILGLSLASPASASTLNPLPQPALNHGTFPTLSAVYPHMKARSAHDAPLTLGQKIVMFARKLLYTPYVWGGSSPSGFDCSGFTKYVFSVYGINLPRTASEQETLGTYVNKGDLQPGDLLFFDTDGSGISHVGIYIGAGQFISAASTDVRISNINSAYWSSTFVTARKIS